MRRDAASATGWIMASKDDAPPAVKKEAASLAAKWAKMGEEQREQARARSARLKAKTEAAEGETVVKTTTRTKRTPTGRQKKVSKTTYRAGQPPIESYQYSEFSEF